MKLSNLSLIKTTTDKKWKKKKLKIFWVFFWIIFFFSKKLIFMKNNSKSLEKKISIFLKKYFFFHKCCKNTKIVSGYAYFTTKLFEMCLKGCCRLVCAFRWKKKTNFESFSVSQNLVIFQNKHKKRRIFATFFFDPTLFSVRNRQTANKITSAIPND